MTEGWFLPGAVPIRVPAHLLTKEIIDKVFAFPGAKQKPLPVPFWHTDLMVPVDWQLLSKYLHPSKKDQIGQVTVFSEPQTFPAFSPVDWEEVSEMVGVIYRWALQKEVVQAGRADILWKVRDFWEELGRDSKWDFFSFVRKKFLVLA